MFISTCGFGSTGSSAVCDLLLECDNIQVFDAVEFTIATTVDGLEDLEYHLMHRHSRLSSSIYAIQRFRKYITDSSREWCVETGVKKGDIDRITDKFINKITQLEFVGYDPKIDKKHLEFLRHYLGESIIQNRILRYLEKHHYIKNNIDYYPLGRVQASIEPDCFYSAAREFVSELLEIMGCDFGKNLVLDQAFVGNDPVKSFPFYKDPYAIVVDRDPRDLYIFAKKFLLSKGRFMPTDTVEHFITYYRIMRDNQPYKTPNERVLVIRFEDLVYDYDITKDKIINFLNLKHLSPKTIFVPEHSAANTNLIRKYPEFRDDVEIIEKALPEYLFPFENFPTMDKGGKMFFGKSPLNKQ